MCCQFHMYNDSVLDKKKRITIIKLFVDLMVYDIAQEKGGVDP